MKKLRVGLVVEGNSTASVILRLSSVTGELGPVKSGSLQVARRVSNFLRAGYAVSSYDELSAAKLILIRVPDAAVPRVVKEICASELPLTGLCFVLCETWMQTEVLKPLRERGAHVSSVVAATEGKVRCFAVEGDLPAVRTMRRLLERGGTKTLELRAGAKHLLFAATVLLTVVPIPVMLAAQQALRESGVSGNQLAQLLQDLSTGTLTSFLRGPRAASSGLLANCAKEDADEYFARLQGTHPELATSIKGLVEWANVQIPRRLAASSNCATDQSCAGQPPGICGSSAS